jgi:hypothetical protein
VILKTLAAATVTVTASTVAPSVAKVLSVTVTATPVLNRLDPASPIRFRDRRRGAARGDHGQPANRQH